MSECERKQQQQDTKNIVEQGHERKLLVVAEMRKLIPYMWIASFFVCWYDKKKILSSEI